jgi:hypothetical protein
MCKKMVNLKGHAFLSTKSPEKRLKCLKNIGDLLECMHVHIYANSPYASY